jgi:hypothetical protein
VTRWLLAVLLAAAAALYAAGYFLAKADWR